MVSLRLDLFFRGLHKVFFSCFWMDVSSFLRDFQIMRSLPTRRIGSFFPFKSWTLLSSCSFRLRKSFRVIWRSLNTSRSRLPSFIQNRSSLMSRCLKSLLRRCYQEGTKELACGLRCNFAFCLDSSVLSCGLNAGLWESPYAILAAAYSVSGVSLSSVGLSIGLSEPPYVILADFSPFVKYDVFFIYLLCNSLINRSAKDTIKKMQGFYLKVLKLK